MNRHFLITTVETQRPNADGSTTTLPVGTTSNEVLWDGVSPWTPPDGARIAPDGWVFLTPPPEPVIVPTTLDPIAFMARLTMAEQLGITTAAQSSPMVMLFLIKMAGAAEINVTDGLTTAGMAAMVSAGLLTADRGAQVLDLSRASP